MRMAKESIPLIGAITLFVLIILAFGLADTGLISSSSFLSKVLPFLFYLSTLILLIYSLSLHRFKGDMYRPLQVTFILIFLASQLRFVFHSILDINVDYSLYLMIIGVGGGILLATIFYAIRLRNKPYWVKFEKLKGGLIIATPLMFGTSFFVPSFLSFVATLLALPTLLTIPAIFIFNHKNLHARKRGEHKVGIEALIDELGGDQRYF